MKTYKNKENLFIFFNRIKEVRIYDKFGIKTIGTFHIKWKI